MNTTDTSWKHLQRRRCGLVLYDLQSPVNIGQILRTGEQMQIRVMIYDPRQIFADPDKLRTISDFSCGSITRLPPRIISDYPAFKARHRGRIIATCLRSDATHLRNFCFQQEDMILLGNEYDGLPPSVIDAADAALYIPLPKADLPKPRSFSPIDPSRAIAVAQDGIPNLNVSVSASIIGYMSHLQSGFVPIH